GLINAAFFDRLREERPGKGARINGLEQLWQSRDEASPDGSVQQAGSRTGDPSRGSGAGPTAQVVAPGRGTVARWTPPPLDRSFDDALARFCAAMSRELDDIDKELNWSDTDFTELEAEVEVERGSLRPRVVSDLVRAIRRDRKTGVFLVIGDPGSG